MSNIGAPALPYASIWMLSHAPGTTFETSTVSIAATGEFERKPGDIIAFDRNGRAIGAGSLVDDDGSAR